MSPLKLNNSDEAFGQNTTDKIVIKLQKFNLKVLDAILSNFHFNVIDEVTVDSELTQIDNVICVNDVAKLIPDLLSKLYIQTYTSRTKHVSESFADIHECIVRAPFAVVIARFLKALPHHIMQIHLRGLVLHLLNLLKSRHSNLRDISREVLAKLVDIVGPECFPLVVNEMSSLLNKGYQKSVACFSVHFLLCHLSASFVCSKELLDSKTMSVVLKWVRNDLLSSKKSALNKTGDQANLLTSQKFKECCVSKSYDTLVILGSITHKENLFEFVNAFKGSIGVAHDINTINRLNKIYEMIIAGFIKNSLVRNEEWIQFGLDMYQQNTSVSKNQDVLVHNLAPTSKIVLPEMISAVIDDETKAELTNTALFDNNYVIDMFILHVFSFVLKRAVGGASISLHLLDAMVEPTLSCLKSSSTEVLFKSANVMGLLLKLDLSSMSSSVKLVIEMVFQIMTKYSSGALSTVNVELTVSVFKVTSTLVAKYEKHLTNDMFRILVIQCERHIDDCNHVNAGVFSVLKCILRNGFVCAELNSLVDKLKTLSVVCGSDSVRSQCENMVKLFFTNYKSTNQLKLFVEYYLGNLNYEKESGRLSSLELLRFFIENVKPTQMETFINELFLNFSLLLNNDDSIVCREKASTTLSILLTKLTSKQRSRLFEISLLWLNHNQSYNIIQMGCVLMTIFKDVEKGDFNNRISLVFNRMNETLAKLLDQCDSGVTNDSSNQTDIDITVYKLLHLIESLLKNTEINFIRKVVQNTTLSSIYDQIVTRCLNHSHIWPRQMANEIVCFNLYLSSPDLLALSLTKKKSSNKVNPTRMFFTPRTFDNLLKLTKSVLKQLKSPLSTAQQDDSALKNLIFICRTVLFFDKISKHSSISYNQKLKHSSTSALTFRFDEKSQLTISNLIEIIFFKLLSYANSEISSRENSERSISKRMNLLKWIAAITSYGKEHENLDSPHYSDRLLNKMFNFIKRETNSDVEELLLCCEEVTLLLKSCFGNVLFNKIQENAEKQLTDKKNRKRSATALQAVSDPTLFAIKKMKIKQRKRLKKSS